MFSTRRRSKNPSVNPSRKRSNTLLRLEPLESRTLLAVLTDTPIVGGVTQSEAKVWVRTDVQAQAKVEYSVNPDLSASQLSGSERTLSGKDFTGIIAVSGLTALTKYYYRIVLDSVATQTENFASFTTFATPGSSEEFTFAVAADLESGNIDPTIPAPVYAQIAADVPDFFMQIGDFDHRNPGKLSKMREMHRQVRSGAAMASAADFAQQIADQFPVFHVWDDNDYGPNNGDKLFPNRGDALRAFKEYWPTPALSNPDAGIWHSFSYSAAEFFMLDLRSQRDPFLDPEGAEKSMLDGDGIVNSQKDWLKAELLNSTSTWKFVVSTVPFNATVLNKDGWAEYDTERQEILDFINGNNIQGVVMISGDMHFGGGIDDGTNSGVPEINVPHTNMTALHANTTNVPGTWSEGIITGVDNPGYALIRVTANTVTMENKGADGVVRQSFVLGAAQPAEIGISGLSQEIASGDTTPSTVDDTEFGSSLVGSPVTHTFTISNAGPGALSVTDVQIAGANASDFTVSQSPAGSVAAGESTTFQIQFTAGEAGLRAATVTVANSDADESSYTFAIQGTGVALQPEISITGLGQEIVSGDTTPSTTDDSDFGSTTAANPVTHTFTIANTGTGALSIAGVQLTGTNAADFSVVQSPAASVSAGQSTEFQVRFTPGATGARTASVTVSNSDANEGSYTFAIQGTGGSTAFERIIDDGDSGFSRKGTWSDRNDAAAYQGDYDFSGSTNSTTTKTTWSFSGLANGQYLVYATYVAGTDRATAASYKLYDGGTREGKAALNQRNAPNDNFAAGIWWEQLPTMSISRGLLEVKLDAGASGREVADAIRIVKVEAQQSQVLSFVETSSPATSENNSTKINATSVEPTTASNSPSVANTKTAAAAADYSRRLHRRAKATDQVIASDEFLRELFVGRKRK